jgi:polyribonucleotide nucleotidyltransferase
MIKYTTEYNGQTLTLETGRLANQATSSVLATLGGTTVLAAITVGKDTEADYMPLQVVYEERLYAARKIHSSRFSKREGRPSDNAVLTGRMIDRSIRSLFDKNIRSEIQVVVTVLSLDEINPPDTLAVLAVSSALSLCDFVEK